jgi:hypothetical protein
MVSNDNFSSNDQIKIRVSDHSVSNINRIFDEVHVKNENESNIAINRVKYYFDRDKHFTNKEVNVYKIARQRVKQTEPGDVILNKGKTKKNEDIYDIERKIKNKTSAYFTKDTNELYLIKNPDNDTKNFNAWILEE